VDALVHGGRPSVFDILIRLGLVQHVKKCRRTTDAAGGNLAPKPTRWAAGKHSVNVGADGQH